LHHRPSARHDALWLADTSGPGLWLNMSAPEQACG
jgi:hypothetical protein